MRKLFLSLCVAAPILLAVAANAQQKLAQQTVTFLCAAPAGHVCQFAVQRGGSQIEFALPSGKRKRVSGVTPRADKVLRLRPGPGHARLQGAPSGSLVLRLLAQRRPRPEFGERLRQTHPRRDDRKKPTEAKKVANAQLSLKSVECANFKSCEAGIWRKSVER